MKLTLRATEYDDGHPGCVAVCEDVPELIGQGDDHDEAVDDFLDQYGDRTLH